MKESETNHFFNWINNSHGLLVMLLIFSLGSMIFFGTQKIRFYGLTEGCAECYQESTYGRLFVETSDPHLPVIHRLRETNQYQINDSNLNIAGKLSWKIIYNHRYEHYQNTNKSMSNILQLMAALMLIGLLILFYRPKYLKIPILNIEMPRSLMYLSASIGLVYLWLQFGLTLNAGIDSRLALHFMTLLRENIGDFEVAYVFSDTNTLLDRGVVDAWCTYYYDVMAKGLNGESHAILSFFGLFVIYGTLWGVIHATCFILLITYYEIKKAWIILLLLIIAVALFFISDYSFFDEFKHATLLLSWTWGIASTCLILWYFFGVDHKSIPKEKH